LTTETQPLEETWNISDIFNDDESFERARAALVAAAPELDRWRGRLAESAATLADALEKIAGAYQDYYRLRCYASLCSDRDTRVVAYQAMRQGVELLGTELSSRLAFVRPEILSTEPETLESFIRQEPRLESHAFFLRDLIRQRAHVLGHSEERILAEAGLITQSAPALFNVLNNVELPRSAVELHNGEEVRLTPVEFHRQRVTQHRGDRLKLFPAFFGAYGDFNDTLGQNLYALVKSHLFPARVRGYDSCLAAAVDRNNVPVAVYHNLIEQVRGRLPLLHRYLKLRAKALGLTRLEYPDMYCPLVEAPPRSYEPAEARELLTDSLAPLGSEYVEDLRAAYDGRWIDWHPAPGKRSGAYATGWAYDVHPYVLLNYTNNYEGVSTLAHEMGHAMHSSYSNRTQPFATADYSIFVAEVASTLNESLLATHMIDRAESDQERLYLLASHLDGLRGTLFRQTMFAEFELAIHERAERGEVLTGESLNAIYLDLLRAYHGHEQGVMQISDEYAVEWAAVPHFYYDFYVYQYSTGVVAATALATAQLEGSPEESRRYVEFLGAGGSDYPLALLRRAGVDLETRQPYDLAFAAMECHLDRMEALLEAAVSRRQTQ
jgi:oligoendopeptidase F